MEVLKFTLSGKNAIFKKPDVNSYFYFTYGNIHKVALLGIFGAILGYSGYGKAKEDIKGNLVFGEKEKLPTFYEKLEHVKIGIEPLYENGLIPKKIQVFNNSVGYASKELGGNLIVKEQWLENPMWNIYLLLEDTESRKIADAILHKTCVFQPYLGKNDHFADIKDVQVLLTKECSYINKIHNLFQKSMAEFALLDEEEEEEDRDENRYKYEESLPLRLKENTILYEEEPLIFTNLAVQHYKGRVLEVGTKCIAFY